MKKIIIALLCIALKTTAVLAQADSLSLDENNKFIYYQVVTQQSTADSLYHRGLNFLKTAFTADKLKLDKQDKGKATLYAKGGTLVAKKSAMNMHEDGRISYTMVIEVKDNKYRYWFTDYVLTPYERDRYANFVPALGKDYPLENAADKLSKKDLDGYMQKLLADCRSISNKLKAYMKNPLPKQIKEIKKRSITTKEW